MADVWLRHHARQAALQGVRFQVRRGEFVFLVGHTGSGKTSLLKLLNRELQPTSGKIWVDGHEIGQLPSRDIPWLRRRIGVVFQDFRLLPDRTLAENVAFALRVTGVHGAEVRDRTRAVLNRVGILGKSRFYPHQVSGGEQQRAALARALVNEPPLLLADEPTGNLDPDTSRDIMDLLLSVQEAGTTVLVATHDQPIVDQFGKRVLELDAGRLVRDEPRGRYAAFTPIPHANGTHPRHSQTAPPLLRVGRE
ncbi:MAG: cell division ATP-binding protein FtsE [Armatimonadetes bacterium]|nr:cell division ATP-binding protein FtsE [Armatimonadota bacterium]